MCTVSMAMYLLLPFRLLECLSNLCNYAIMFVRILCALTVGLQLFAVVFRRLYAICAPCKSYPNETLVVCRTRFAMQRIGGTRLRCARRHACISVCVGCTRAYESWQRSKHLQELVHRLVLLSVFLMIIVGTHWFL